MRCRYYDGYYYEGACGFYKKKCGYCSQKEKPVANDGSCELYKSKQFKRKTVTPEMLDGVIAEVEELIQIFNDG